jgi:hypothetical protein
VHHLPKVVQLYMVVVAEQVVLVKQDMIELVGPHGLTLEQVAQD